MCCLFLLTCGAHKETQGEQLPKSHEHQLLPAASSKLRTVSSSISVRAPSPSSREPMLLKRDSWGRLLRCPAAQGTRTNTAARRG